LASVVIVDAVFVSFATFAARNFAGMPRSSIVPTLRCPVIVSVPVVPAGITRSAHVSSVAVPLNCANVIRPAEAVVVPKSIVVFTVAATVAPRIPRAHPQGKPSFWDDGHGFDSEGHFAVDVAASAVVADPESPLEPPDRLIATGDAVTAMPDP
jgi:hypothetical protein